MCDRIDQDSADGAGGADPGHSPEHVRHGAAGGADPAAQRVQQPRYSFKTHMGAHAEDTERISNTASTRLINTPVSRQHIRSESGPAL